MKKYDVIIVGAGVAGATAAYLMKKNNKKVLLVERNKQTTKDKLCGGLLSKRSYDLLCSIFGVDCEKLSIQKNHNVIIHNKEIVLDIKLDTISTYRKDLDDFILEEYLNLNGEFMDGVQYKNLDLNSNTLEINDNKYKFDYLVSADGVFSSLRKDITGKFQRKNFAFEILTKNKYKNLEIFFFDQFKGYGWIIPNSKNTMIGIGEVSQKTKIDYEFNAYLQKLEINARDVKGAFLPTGNDIFLNYKNVFFVGDSAGLISPITGEGIYYALLSSKMLSENLNKTYPIKMKKILKKIKREQLCKKYVYNDRIRNYLFSKYNHNVFIKKAIMIFVKKIL